jgi:hypothetical protein
MCGFFFIANLRWEYLPCKLAVAHFVSLVLRSITGNAFSLIIIIIIIIIIITTITFSRVLTLRYVTSFLHLRFRFNF